MHKKSLLTAILLVLFLLIPAAALAADHVVAEGEVFDLSRCVSGDTVTLTLLDVRIDNSAVDGSCALSFTSGMNNLILSGINTLKSGEGQAGINIEQYALLNISGAGSLSAYGGALAAGIGGSHEQNTGHIRIYSGTINATGGIYAAGIGGRFLRNCDIRIFGGTINAIGGYCAAGIGGGNRENGYIISISGGTINAIGGTNAAGIGGGYYGYGGCILISNGTVNATGGNGAAGIGGGKYGFGDDIRISGGMVNATGGINAAGIGGGEYGFGGNILISNGTVTAMGGIYAAGIGGGDYGFGGHIFISSGTVTAKGGINAAGVGGGRYGSGGGFYITSGMVNATGGIEAAGIGGGYCGSGGYIAVGGGIISAFGGSEAAGIGGGCCGSSGTINIYGGIVYAEKGTCASNSTAVDIGISNFGIPGQLQIWKTAAVFLRSDSCITPDLPNGHMHKTPRDATDPMLFNRYQIYGMTVPALYWTKALGGYFRLMTVTYDSNGGIGRPPSSPPAQHIGTAVIAASSFGITKPGYTANAWNMQANGRGVSYSPGDKVELTPDLTLFVLWIAEK